MSGIFGICGEVGAPVDERSLRNMSDALFHRGPDDHRLWRENHVGLGHRMLRTSPEASVEILPYHDLETGLVISSDARLDNRAELIDRLGKDGFKVDLIPDSRIILSAYCRWKSECLQHLVGDFSFAIWDSNVQKLFCARDHFGVKPFFYYFQGGIFIFCSESKVIAEISGIDVSINEARLADALTPHLEGLDKTSTCYKQVLRLPPAHYLEITRDKMSLQEYWKAQPSKEILFQSDAEYQEALTEILTRSVAARCRGIENPAILLSGGVDSAAILGLSRHLYKNNALKNVHSFSGISENIGDCKESQMIQRLVESGGFEHHLYTVESLKELIDKVFPLIQKIQEPFDICMVIIFLLYQQASEAGNNVVLDGVDGDMVTSISSNYPIHLLRQGRFGTALKEAIGQAKGVYKDYKTWYMLFCRYLLSAWTPDFIKQVHRETRCKSRVNGYLSGSSINSVFAKRIGLLQRLEQFEQGNTRVLHFPGEQYAANVQHPFLVVGLERYDRVASLCSVEPRHPFINKQLVDFYTSLPWNQFSRNGWSKFLLRKVAQQFIPDEVAWRVGNEHLGGEFTSRLLSIKNMELEKSLRKEETLLKKYIEDELPLHSSSEKDSSTSNKQAALSSDVVGVALWLRHNRENLS